jgi:hypothetical protein
MRLNHPEETLFIQQLYSVTLVPKVEADTIPFPKNSSQGITRKKRTSRTLLFSNLL